MTLVGCCGFIIWNRGDGRVFPQSTVLFDGTNQFTPNHNVMDCEGWVSDEVRYLKEIE